MGTPPIVNGSGSLYELLHADSLPETELRTMVTMHFRHGSYARPGQVDYCNSAPADGLTLVYGKDGQLTDVRSGAAIDNDALGALVTEIARELDTRGTQVARSVLFAAVPSKHQWRYGDDVQLRPVPDSAPTTDELLSDHPLILEASHKAASSWLLRQVRGRRTLRRWELFLNVLLGYHIHAGSRYVSKRWTLVTDASDPGKVETRFLQEGYVLGNHLLPDGSFSHSDAPSVLIVPDTDYYSRRGLSADATLAAPACLPVAIAAFNAMAAAEQDRFLRACYWFQLADRQWSLSHSASYTSLVNAVESLVPAPAPGPTCPECKRPASEGPTRAFDRFVETYAAGTTGPDRRALYKLRSAIAHGGRIMSIDDDLSFGGLYPLRWDQRTLHERLRHVCQVALVNWVLTAGAR